MKTIFHSFLAPQLKSYFEFRQKLGYTSFADSSQFCWAKDLDHYVLFHSLSSMRQLDEGFLVNWVHAIAHRSPGTKNKLLSFARGFFNYLIRLGLAHDNPAQRVRDLRIKPYKPYIFTLKEIQQLLEEARLHKYCWAPKCFIGPTMETIIFLLYACGLRISEALNLKIQDVDFEENILSLWKTKFHKERLVPFSTAAAKKLKVYLDLRTRHFPPVSPQDPFFCHRAGKYTKHPIEEHFRQLLVRCGMAKPKGRGAPRLHDLRHSMATHRLYKWYQDGHDILNKLPLLSVHMGHVNIENTQVYLTVTQALLREADRRFQGAFEEVTQRALNRALKNRP